MRVSNTITPACFVAGNALSFLTTRHTPIAFPSLSSRSIDRGSINRHKRNTACWNAATDEESVEDSLLCNTFWGKERTEQEIKSFAYQAVFENVPEIDAEGGRDVQVLNMEPPLLVIHGFLDDKMCDVITKTASNKEDGLKRSTTGSEQETDDIRTSETTWVREKDGCDESLRTFASRASRLSGLPPGNMENLQVVRYKPTQKFDLHTDHLDSFNNLDCRGRLATCLLYLNSNEDDEQPEHDISFTGGETNFPEFDISVVPRKGSAIFFWNTEERPGNEGYEPLMHLNVDFKLRHAGLPVLTGEKWVCNRWIHPIDFGAGVRGR